jgi:hypothetical protein
MRASLLACAPLLASAAFALPEILIAKKHKHGAKPVLRKRQGTVETNVFDIITYSTGGAYYANSKMRSITDMPVESDSPPSLRRNTSATPDRHPRHRLQRSLL